MSRSHRQCISVKHCKHKEPAVAKADREATVVPDLTLTTTTGKFPWLTTFLPCAGSGSSDDIVLVTDPTMIERQRRQDLAELKEVRWADKTIVLTIVFHVYSNIEGVNSASDQRSYYDLMLSRLNQDYNMGNEEIADASVTQRPLLNVSSNPSNAPANKAVYKAYMNRARGANIRFEVDYAHCEYNPSWNGFARATAKEKESMSSTDSADYRTLTDKYVKFDSKGMPTAYSPRTRINIWIVDFLDPSLCGYSTLADDKQLVGTGYDGIILSANVCQKDPSLMNPALNRWRTLSHEMGHFCNLRHVFEPGTDNVADTPQQTVDFGDVYAQRQWPLTNNRPHMFMNMLDYSDDSNLIMFTHDQVVAMRRALLNPYSGRNLMIRLENSPSAYSEGQTARRNVALNSVGRVRRATVWNHARVIVSQVAKCSL